MIIKSNVFISIVTFPAIPICSAIGLVFSLIRTYSTSVLLSFDDFADFVEKNLIRKKQFLGAVRLSCAYNLNVKNKLVDMLREHVQNAKLICDSSCEKTNSIQIKVLLFSY
jgi:hypothetical protein